MHKTKNVTGDSVLSKKIERQYKCSVGLPEMSSGWAHGSGLPEMSSGWAHSSGDRKYSGMKIPNRGDKFINASGGGGKIEWNTTGGEDGKGAYEDTNGHVYIANGDGTFDDGSGINFNADGTLVNSKGFFKQLGDLFTSEKTLDAALEIAKGKIQSNPSITPAQKQEQIAALTSSSSKSWVLPVTLIGGVVVATIAYKYFIAKKK
jgi:hypothetical protein